MAIYDDQSTSSENIEVTQIVALDETLKSDRGVTGDAMKHDHEATGISSHLIPGSESHQHQLSKLIILFRLLQ